MNFNSLFRSKILHLMQLVLYIQLFWELQKSICLYIKYVQNDCTRSRKLITPITHLIPLTFIFVIIMSNNKENRLITSMTMVVTKLVLIQISTNSVIIYAGLSEIVPSFQRCNTIFCDGTQKCPLHDIVFYLLRVVNSKHSTLGH